MIYFGLVLLGAMSLNKMSLSENGGTALSQITNFYLGNFGASFLGVMVTLGVFTTAMGLVVSFAQDFHKLFPKVSYMTWSAVNDFRLFCRCKCWFGQYHPMVFTSIDAFVSIVACVDLAFLNSKIFPKDTICLSSNDVVCSLFPPYWICWQIRLL